MALSSALWHFLQTLPFSAAVWQHLWSHFFPASTVASQQGFLSSAARRFETPENANAQTATDNIMAFIVFSVLAGLPSLLCYFFTYLTFLGWHFSQTLPSLAALTQHLWSHFLPASIVASQHPARRLLELTANAIAANTSDFTDFIDELLLAGQL